MKNIKRIAACFIAVIMCLGVLVGCSEDDGSDTMPGNVVDTGVSESGAKLNLPELDYDGAEISILVRTQSLANHYAEDIAGSVTSQAVFERNVIVEQLLDVTLKFKDLNGYSSGATEFSNAIRTSAMSDGTYDIVSPPQTFGNTLIAEGMYTDLNKYEYLDLSETYWADGYNKQALVNGKQYTISGDYSIDLLTETRVIFMNKAYLNIFGDAIENPYTLAKEGKWTLAKLLEISKTVTYDVDNSGTWDDKDQYGWYMYGGDFSAMATSSDINYITKDGDDYYFTIAEEKSLLLYETLTNAMNDSTIRYFAQDQTSMVNSFLRGRAMFFSYGLGYASELKSSNIEYGIIVPPKYDEEQEEYRIGSNGLTVFAITTGLTEERATRSAAVLQALGYYTHTKVIPVFFETFLQGQVAQDIESYEMLETIRANAYFDVGLVFSRSLSNIYGAYQDAYSKNLGLSTWWEQNERICNTSLNELINSFKD